MGRKKKSDIAEDFDEKNAAALAGMLSDPKTSPAVKLQIINELNEASKAETFFETMYEELLTLGKCPCCNHENHWLIPEDELNVMGWVTHQKDKNVKVHTDAEDCKEFGEACSKKRVTA